MHNLKSVIAALTIVCGGFLSHPLPGFSAESKDDTATLKKEIEELKHQLTRLQDVNDIQRLMGRYETIHNTSDISKSWELFADRPDTWTQIADHPRQVGYENVKKEWMGQTQEGAGVMLEHPLSTPIIVVADDGQTAKATFVSLGHETHGGSGGGAPGGMPGGAPGGAAGGSPPSGVQGGSVPPSGGPGAAPSGAGGGPPAGGAGTQGDSKQNKDLSPEFEWPPAGGTSAQGDSQMRNKNFSPEWAYGKYALDFIKVDGEWKIWHEKWFRVFRTSFYTAWSDNSSSKIGKAIATDTVYFHPYTTDAQVESIPPAPKPYKTWTKAEENWMFKASEQP
jgi:hypothetical protein